MKKLFILVLLFMVGLFVTLPTYASHMIIYEGDEYNLYDTNQFEYEFLIGSDRINIIPTTSVYLSGGVNTQINYFDDAYQLMTDYGIDIQTQTISTEYTVEIRNEIANSDGNIDDHFTHLVFDIPSGDKYYYLIPTGTASIEFGFDYIYSLDYDSGEDENFISDGTSSSFYIGIDEVYTEQWSTASIYLIDLYPEHDNFISGSLSRNYWVGYDTTSEDAFSLNYLYWYFVYHIGAYANNNTELNDLLDDYIVEWSTVGITVTLPTNYEVGLFVPEWYDGVIDEWYEIYEPVSTINFRIPDLNADGVTLDLLEPNFGLTELWGTSVTYLLDGTDSYSFFLDELEIERAPRIGFYVATVGRLVTFNTNGGSLVASQTVALGSSPVTPTAPTYEGYQFRGWTTVSTINPIQQYTETNVYNYSLGGFDIYNDVTFYAIWREVVITIDLIPNGGLRVQYDGFLSNRLFTLYGDSAENNTIEIDLDEAYFKLGYAFLGWYLDEELTIPFNETVPLTYDLTIYAKWVQSDVGSESPSALNEFLDNLGLLNFPTLFIIYLVFVVTFVLIGLRYAFPSIVYIIFTILLSSVWWFFGWFNTVSTLIILLLTVFILVWISKERTI